MDAGLSDHSDAFNVFPLDAKVGATDGDGDASQHGSETRDDLGGEIHSVEVRWAFIARQDLITSDSDL